MSVLSVMQVAVFYKNKSILLLKKYMILIPSWRVHQIRMLLKYLYFGIFAYFFVCLLVGFVRLFGSYTRDMLHGFYSGKSNKNDSSVPKKMTSFVLFH